MRKKCLKVKGNRISMSYSSLYSASLWQAEITLFFSISEDMDNSWCLPSFPQNSIPNLNNKIFKRCNVKTRITWSLFFIGWSICFNGVLPFCLNLMAFLSSKISAKWTFPKTSRSAGWTFQSIWERKCMELNGSW